MSEEDRGFILRGMVELHHDRLRLMLDDARRFLRTETPAGTRRAAAVLASIEEPARLAAEQMRVVVGELYGPTSNEGD